MKKLVTFLFLSLTTIYSQTSTWFPASLNIQPFTANFIEPRAGFNFSLGEPYLRLDIGTSSDFYRYEKENSVLSFGGDLYTYTRLRSTKEFHFPVETIDYLFGFNAGYKVSDQCKEYGMRFRFSHISAHLVDGRYDYNINGWKEGQNPRVYSREFLEFFPFIRFSGLRFYAGYTYLIHVTPTWLGKSIFQAGFDYFYVNEKLPFTPFAAYDLKLSKVSKYAGSQIFEAGIKFGRYDKKGFSILFSYLSGRSIHGEYFDKIENYPTLGFNLDL